MVSPPDFEPMNQPDQKLRMTITDSNLTFTPMGRILLSKIIKQENTIWSELLTSKDEGEYQIVEPKPRLDGRDSHQRFIELVWLAINIRVATNDLVMDFEIPCINRISTELKSYIPQTTEFDGTPVWIAHETIVKLFTNRYPEIVLHKLVGGNLPTGVDSYSIESQLVQMLLEPYVLLVVPSPTFGVVTEFMAVIEHADIQTAQLVIADLNVTSATTEIMKDKLVIRTATYGSLMQIFVSLKKDARTMNLNFKSDYSGPLAIKIIKNYLWAPTEVIAEIVSAGFLAPGDFKQDSRISIRSGTAEIVRMAISNGGYQKLLDIFGKTILEAAFKIRMNRKAEITGDRTLLEEVFNWIDDAPDKFTILQRTVSSIVFQGIKDDRPYTDIMGIYFMLKSRFSITMVSELKHAHFKIGIDALEDAAMQTDFGGGRSLPSFTKIGDDWYLTGEKHAANLIFEVLPEAVRQDVQIQEIAEGVFGRRLTQRAYSYIRLLLI
jgi:hypothetical protein